MVKQIAHDLIISADWGTSAFRLYLFQVTTQKVIASIYSDQGVRSIHELCDSDVSPEKEVVFKEVLADHLAQLARAAKKDLDGLPVIISGMVGSSIGWQDLPYARLPVRTDGSDLVTKMMSVTEGFNHQVILVSGVSKGSEDIMRGEETQLVGLVNQLGTQDCWFVFPGTHSKHVLVENGQITDFNTFMTGEMYQLMTEHSILKSSLKYMDDFDEQAFVNGVRQGSKQRLLPSLFTLRAQQVTSGDLVPSDRLSGLLIGNELAVFRNQKRPVYVCASKAIGNRYRIALNCLYVELGESLDEGQMDTVVPTAHMMLLKQLGDIKG